MFRPQVRRSERSAGERRDAQERRDCERDEREERLERKRESRRRERERAHASATWLVRVLILYRDTHEAGGKRPDASRRRGERAEGASSDRHTDTVSDPSV